MKIRQETSKDYEIVENLIREAFWNKHVPGAMEHYLAHSMRDHPDFIKELDLVVEMDDQIVGSIMFTRCLLIDEKGIEKTCVTFGPLAIAPRYQRKGIAKKLIAFSLNKAKEMGYDCVVIFGHPSNYITSGFISCKKVNIALEEDYYPTAMLVKILNENTFEKKKWTYKESTAYILDESKFEEFDAKFPYKEKKVLPSQEEFYIYSHSSLK